MEYIAKPVYDFTDYYMVLLDNGHVDLVHETTYSNKDTIEMQSIPLKIALSSMANTKKEEKCTLLNSPK